MKINYNNFFRNNINNLNCNFNTQHSILSNKIENCDVISFKGKEKNLTALSVNLHHKETNKEYNIVSLPVGMNYENGNYNVEKKVPTIAIIDVFSDFGKFNLGQGITIPHGNIVSKYALNGLEDKIGVIAFDTTPKSKSEFDAMSDALKDLVNIQKKHKNITAINLSVGVNTTFESLSYDMGINITPKNVIEKKDDIIDFIRTSRNKKYANASSIINSINELVNNGVQIFSSSGNLAQNGFDLLSLSNAQHIVGANDYDNTSRSFCTNYSDGCSSFFINLEGEQIKSVSDGIISFDKTEISTRKRNFFSRIFGKNNIEIKGTSFACPKFLNNYLKKLFK